MRVVYHNNQTKLEKKSKDTWNLTVNWEGPTKKFWINFPYPLLKIIKQTKVKDNYKQFTIKAESIKSLASFLKEKKNHLSYDSSIEMLFDLGNQLQSLERFYMGIPFMDINDIIDVDEKHYFYLNDNKLLDIKNNKLDIDEPYKKSLFFSPELDNIKQLPTSISYKAGYYSLASMVVFCMLDDKITEDNKNAIMSPIYTSKLYWALMRMLEKDPSDRFYLII